MAQTSEARRRCHGLKRNTPVLLISESLERLRDRHVIFGDALQPVVREIGPARIADEHGRATPGKRREPAGHRVRHVLLVGHVSGQHDVPALVRAGQVFEPGGHGDPVFVGVGANGRAGEGVDVGRLDRSRAGERGGDGDEARAGGEIERPAAAHALRVIENVAGERLPARPGERPERRRQGQVAAHFSRCSSRSARGRLRARVLAPGRAAAREDACCRG